MSKRSNRRAKQQRKKENQARLKPDVLIEQGTAALGQQDYALAVERWRLAYRKRKTAQLASALAEGLFRIAVTDPNADSLACLEEAVELQPKDQIYRYHLALAYHRQGALDEAEPIYQELVEAQPPFERAIQPFMQLMIERKMTVLRHPLWKQLPKTTQDELAVVEALFKGKASSTLTRLLEKGNSSVWDCLLAFRLGNTGKVLSLSKSLRADESLPAVAQALVTSNLGLFAWQAGDKATATAYWEEAQMQYGDLHSLQLNQATIAYIQLLTALQRKQWSKAVELSDSIPMEQIFALGGRELYRYLRFLRADQAAQTGNWHSALKLWQDVLKQHPNDRSVAFNIALATDRIGENSLDAAQKWREILRRRPRKENNPYYLDEQMVARIWQAVAENYSKADWGDEAIKTYKNAVKWAPDNIDLKMKLTEALQEEGRWQAAENELNRVLEKDPKHVPAMLMLAESYADNYLNRPVAKRLFLDAIQLEPDNVIAQQHLAMYYQEEAQHIAYWQGPDAGIEMLEEGLKYAPDNAQLLTVLGVIYIKLKKEVEQGREIWRDALAKGNNNLSQIHQLTRIWLDERSEPDITEMFALIETLPETTPLEFFQDILYYCDNQEYTAEAEAFSAMLKRRAPQNADIRFVLVDRYRFLDDDRRAMVEVRELLKIEPEHGMGNLRLGTMYYEQGQTRLGKKYWAIAEKVGKAQGDHFLLHELRMIKDHLVYGKRTPATMGDFLNQISPEMIGDLLKDLPPEMAAMIQENPQMLQLLLGGMMDDMMDSGFEGRF